MATPNDLIAKGPVSAEEAAQVRRVEHETIPMNDNQPASEASSAESQQAASDTPTTIENADDKPVDLSAFDKIIDRDNNPELTVTYDKKLLEEEKRAVEKESEQEKSDTSASEEASKVSEAARLLAAQKTQAKKEGEGGDKETTESETSLPPTARPLNTAKSGTTTVADYTDEELAAIDPDLPGFTKKMDRYARDFVVGRLKAANDIIKNKARGINELPASWYEAEDAYTLLPQYKAGAGELQQLQAIEAHYKEQLASIQNGETKWIDVVRAQDGSLQTVEREVDPKNMGQVSVLLSTRLNRTNTIIAEKARALDGMAQTFRQTAQQGKQIIKQLEDHFFPQYSDPEVTKNDPVYTGIKQVLESKGLGNNILTNLYSKLYAFSIEVQKENEALKKGSANGPTKGAANRNPGLQDINGATTSSQGRAKNPLDAPVDFDAFERIKEGIR